MPIKDLEIKRKIAHIILGFLVILLIYYNLISVYQLFIIFCLGLIISMLSIYCKTPIVSYLITEFERVEDSETIPGKGAIYGLAGVIIALTLFEKNIALASICILTIGDAFSLIIGKYGKIKNPFHSKKYLEGTIGAIILSSIVAFIFVDWWSSFLGSFVALIIETLDEKLNHGINDNILIPIIAGTLMTFLQFI